MAENKPLANFENPRFTGKRPSSTLGSTGRVGTGGVRATLTTAMTGSNNDVVLNARKAGTAASLLKLQIADQSVINHPGRLVFGGIPASVVINPSSGTDFKLIARDGGAAGNNISITVVDPPGNNVALSVAVSGKDITVTAATDGSSVVTSTAAQIAAAINADLNASKLVEAYITETSSGASAAVSKTNLAGGSDDSNLIYVIAGSQAAAVTIATTGVQLKGLLNGHPLVSADIAPGNDGTGVVTALSATSLAGGIETTGQVLNRERTEDLTDVYDNTAHFAGHSKKNTLGTEIRAPLRANRSSAAAQSTIVKGKKNQEIQQTAKGRF